MAVQSSPPPAFIAESDCATTQGEWHASHDRRRLACQGPRVVRLLLRLSAEHATGLAEFAAEGQPGLVAAGAHQSSVCAVTSTSARDGREGRRPRKDRAFGNLVGQVVHRVLAHLGLLAVYAFARPASVGRMPGAETACRVLVAGHVLG